MDNGRIHRDDQVQAADGRGRIGKMLKPAAQVGYRKARRCQLLGSRPFLQAQELHSWHFS